MFELLLQADRALADGALDRAERTYWQLVELDPTNAIAVAGLARVSLERGNEAAAREFADRALSIDPDSIAARRVLETLDNEGPEPSAGDSTDLPLLAAERLEALSRRHGTESAAAEEGGRPARGAEPGRSAGSDRGGPKRGAGHAKTVALPGTTTAPAAAANEKSGRKAAAAEPEAAEAPGATSQPAASRPGASRPAAPVASAVAAGRKSAAAGLEAAGGSGASAASKQSRGRTRPDRVAPLPSEPLRERHKAGRLAAAAAAAGAAAHDPAHVRHQPHRAMPIGRRIFELVDLDAPSADEFSAAEMAAAVEAVGAVDEFGIGGIAGAYREAIAAPGAVPARGRRSDDLAELLNAVDATDADDSVALRIALVAGADDLEAAELDAARFADVESGQAFDSVQAQADTAVSPTRPAGLAQAPEPQDTEFISDEFEAAEAVAQSQAGMDSARRPAALDGDEFEAAEAVAQSQAGMDSARRPAAPDGDEFEAAEAVAQSQAGMEFGERRAASNEDELAAAGSPAAMIAPQPDAELADADAAEASAAAEAVHEIADTAAATEPEQKPARAPLKHHGGEEPSEEEAEAQALREAVAAVLESNDQIGVDGDPASPGDAANLTSSTQPRASSRAPARVSARASAQPEEPVTVGEPPTDNGDGSESSPRKGGLFHRIRGA